MGLEQLILGGAKPMENPEGQGFELDPEGIRSCSPVISFPLWFFPLGYSCAAHLLILRLAAVIAADCFVISALIGETSKPFL